MTEYSQADQGSGFRHSLAISPARLPLFPGHISAALQALQGPSLSPIEPTRRVWLLYRGRTQFDIWKNAVAAAHKVV